MSYQTPTVGLPSGKISQSNPGLTAEVSLPYQVMLKIRFYRFACSFATSWNRDENWRGDEGLDCVKNDELCHRLAVIVSFQKLKLSSNQFSSRSNLHDKRIDNKSRKFTEIQFVFIILSFNFYTDNDINIKFILSNISPHHGHESISMWFTSNFFTISSCQFWLRLVFHLRITVS